eukprot:gene11483-21699_t
MKKAKFANNQEMIKVRKELENLAKDSKKEYRNASTTEKEAFQQGLGLQKKVVPDQLFSKGKEVLEVSGKYRRGSGNKTVSKDVKLKEDNLRGTEQSSYVQNLVENDTFLEEGEIRPSVVMKGRGVLKKEEGGKPKPKQMKNLLDIDSLLEDFLSTEEEEANSPKPAILSQTNTTRSILYETRKPRGKKYEPPKTALPKKRKESASKKKQQAGKDATHLQSPAGHFGAPSPVIDLGIEKNLMFDDLDEEFYDIVRQKLKLDVGGKKPVSPKGDESTDIKESLAAETEATEDERDDHFNSSKEVIQNEIEDQSYDEAKKSSVVIEERQSDLEADNYPEQAKEEILENKKVQQPIDNDDMENEMPKDQINPDDEDKGLEGQDNELTNDLAKSYEDYHESNMSLQESLDQDIQETVSMDEILKALSLSTKITDEDVINVMGEKATACEKPQILPANSTAFVSKDALHYISKQKRKNSFLISWKESKAKPKGKSNFPQSNIHHFCTQIPEIQLPSHLKLVSKQQHVPDKFSIFKPFGRKITSASGKEETSKEEGEIAEDIEPRILTMIQEKEKPSEEEARLTDLASKILDEAMRHVEDKNAEKSFMKLQNIVDQLFDENDEKILQVDGQKIELKYDATRQVSNFQRLYWTPAPPKFDIPPEAVKQQLIPRYQAPIDVIEEEMERLDELNDVIQDESSSEDDTEIEVTAKQRQRIIARAHGSASVKRTKERQNLLSSLNGDTARGSGEVEKPDDSQDEDRATPLLNSVSEVRRMMAKLREDKPKEEEQVDDDKVSVDFYVEVPKRRTASQPAIQIDDAKFQTFESDFDSSVQELKNQSQRMVEMKDEILKQRQDEEQGNPEEAFPCITINELKEFDNDVNTVDKVDDSATDSNLTIGTKIESSLVPSNENFNSSRRDTRFSEASKKLSVKGTRNLIKKKSPKIKRPDPERERQIQEFLLQAPRKIESQRQRRRSLHCRLDFDKTIGSSFKGDASDAFYWTKENYWYPWFDELYPPSLPSVDEEDIPEQEIEPQTNIDEEILQQIEIIKPPAESDPEIEIYKLLINEIESMTSLIDSTDAPEMLACHLCRRGACYRKTGDLKKAKEDLGRAIELEPKLLDAYWHRHFLFLLQGNTKKALEDLDYILNHNTTHVGAYLSRAELYKKKGDFTMAIFNYSQAIKLRPGNADIYYERAYMFQQRGDILLALEDFKQANSILPTRTEGIRNIGIYHFENSSWTAAINDFTALLTQQPYNEEAYTYRGRAYSKLSMFENALKDLSIAIHLNPNNITAFYFRGCLLRRWEEAISDFEVAIRLDPRVPAAHVNLGLIQMTKMNNPHMAIRRFNIAVRVDPTYVRAYICRAEAFQMLNSRRDAIFDYTRAIHLRPDVIDYRMTRGKLLMEEGQFELASYHIKQCAAMSKGSGTSPTQQAAVYAFLQNYNQAIEILEKTVKSKHVPQLYILLGKTKMKAKLLKEAIDCFGEALRLMKPWDPKAEWPFPAAEVYFLIGMAYTDLVDHNSALDAFNNALKINPEYSECCYQRGLSKMKLRHAKAVQDFNRALAYNPKFFQAYLSRAEYYGMKGRFAKAILNCNEAIRLKPKSIRGYLYRGALKYFIKAYKLAVKDLSVAIAIDPSCNLAYFNRAVCYQEMKHYQKALKDYGVVLLLEKKENMKVLQNRGLLYLEIGDLHNALQDFSTASRLEPRNPKIHHTLGICYHRLGLIRDAVSCFTDALKTDRFFVDALLGRGNAIIDYATAESTTEARRDFLRALHLNPKCLQARVSLAYTLQVQGRFKAAWIQFTKCIELDENFKSAYEGRSIVSLQMGNTFGAFLDINRALEIETTAEFLTNRGVINQFMGDSVNAMRDYQSALKKDPSYSLAYYNAANLYFNHRQFQQALEFYDRAIGWNSTDESAILNRAITRVILKNFNGALEDFNRAAELSPLSAHIYFNRGNLNATLKRYNEAEEDYTTALSLQPGDALVYKRRADVRGKLSKKKEALSDYKKAIRIQTQRIKASNDFYGFSIHILNMKPENRHQTITFLSSN